MNHYLNMSLVLSQVLGGQTVQIPLGKHCNNVQFVAPTTVTMMICYIHSNCNCQCAFHRTKLPLQVTNICPKVVFSSFLYDNNSIQTIATYIYIHISRSEGKISSHQTQRGFPQKGRNSKAQIKNVSIWLCLQLYQSKSLLLLFSVLSCSCGSLVE